MLLLQDWLHAVRVKTLGACLGPALVGSGLALAGGGQTAWIPFLCCGPTAFLIQIGTNLVNDAIDFERGADNSERTGPKRLTQSGAVRPSVVHLAGVLCFLLGLLSAIPAFIARGAPLVQLVVSCSVAGYAYTGGPFPLAYNGLGDLGVLAFFGIAATSGVKYVHQGESLWGIDTCVAGIQVGLLAVNMLAVNNLRDIEVDRKARKWTLAVLMGYRSGRWLLLLQNLIAYLIGIRWIFMGATAAFFLPMLTAPLACKILSLVFHQEPSAEYNKILGMCAGLHLLFCSLLATGLAISHQRME